MKNGKLHWHKIVGNSNYMALINRWTVVRRMLGIGGFGVWDYQETLMSNNTWVNTCLYFFPLGVFMNKKLPNGTSKFHITYYTSVNTFIQLFFL